MKNNFKFLILLTFLFVGVVQAQIGINTTTPNPSSSLDITSTTSGLLIPRMNSAQRDAIVSPANALMIYNTSSNGFEVYKTSCNCWFRLNDTSTVVVVSPTNTAPTAFGLGYSGLFIQGQTCTFSYSYSDAQSDPQGLSTITWQRASNSNGTDAADIAGATNATYTFQLADVDKFVRATITPRATTGVLNGVTVNGGWVKVESINVPTANNLQINGTPAVGTNLLASYTFSGGNGVENTSPSGSTFVWQSATSAGGAGATNASLYGTSAYTNNYTPQNDLIGRFVRVGIRAKDTAGSQAVNFIYSTWVGPITAGPQEAPVAQNVTYSPAPGRNLVHTGSYTYFDSNYDPQGATTFKWYRANSATGAGAVFIAGATIPTYSAVTADVGKYLGFGVTPKALTGTLTGTEVVYYNPNPVTASATFTFTASAIRQLPFFTAGRIMNDQNRIQVEINVTSPGVVLFTSPTVNGYSIATNLTVSTGTQWVTLVTSGTQTNYSVSGDNFTIVGLGQTTQTKAVNIYHTTTGSSLSSHFNGIVAGVSVDNLLSTYTSGETFNNNVTCQNSTISAGYTAATCSGSVTVGSNSYDLVHINGQCWMKTNLKEVPSNFASYTPTSWSEGGPGDLGFWGYYNTVIQDGTAGWGVSEPAPGEGYFYQWSAAMNNSTVERSRGACPEGFHVPSDCEWMYLEHGQGMSIAQQNVMGARAEALNSQGTPGYKLRGVGSGFTNTSGFSFLIPGIRDSSGVFSGRGSSTRTWTSTPSSGTSAYRRVMDSNSRGVTRGLYDKGAAYPIRCLKD
jgi:uncharacterized protein (TIGR02145 family)